MTSARTSSIPDETYEELIDATVTALYKNGYAELGVRDIDAEFSKSRQLINHYFDGKDDLITELLVYVLEYDDGGWVASADEEPLERLNREIDNVLLGAHMDDAEFWTLMTVIYEIQSQAHHNSAHQDLLRRLSTDFTDHLAEIIADGIDQGRFADVDPGRIANCIDDLITGAHIRKISLDQANAPAETREAIDDLVVSRLLADERVE